MDEVMWIEQLLAARRALLALAAGAHGEREVNPKWVVATALQGLGVARPEPPKPSMHKCNGT